MFEDLKDSKNAKSYFPWCHELLSYHILCVGGLESPGSVRSLKKYLAFYGKLVWIRVFPNLQAPGGFAHVILDRPESYHQLFSKSIHCFEGMNLRIKMWRKPSDGSSYDAKINERKVFIKNLASFITEKHLFEYFERFGEIEAIEIPSSGIFEPARKIGYITFQKKQTAELVLQKPNHTLRKNKVKCRQYCPDKKDIDWQSSITIPNVPPVNSEGVQSRGISDLPNINLYKVFKRGKKKFINMQISSEEHQSSSDSISIASIEDSEKASPLSTTNSIQTFLPNKVEPIHACKIDEIQNNPLTDGFEQWNQFQSLSIDGINFNYMRRPVFVPYYTIIEKF